MTYNRWPDLFAPLIGRILVGGYFLWNGIEAALDFPSTIVHLAAAGTPAATAVALFLACVEVLGGVALVVGFNTRAVAVLLAVYCIASALLYLNFTTDLGQTLFLQDMAIVGGLLYISAFGSGPWAADWRYTKKRR